MQVWSLLLAELSALPREFRRQCEAGGSASTGGSALLRPALQHGQEARGASPDHCHKAQAGRARDGLSGSSPLLFPKQPARRCHTRAHGCTRKPGHSQCGKEAPVTICEYCLQVMLPPSPCALSWGCLPAARLWGRESEHKAVSNPSWQLPPPQCRLSSLACPCGHPQLCIRAGCCWSDSSILVLPTHMAARLDLVCVCDPQTAADPIQPLAASPSVSRGLGEP